MQPSVSQVDVNLVLRCFVTVQCEVDEKRPLQPNSVANESDYETQKDCKTFNQQGSEVPVRVNKNTDAVEPTDNNSMETNDQDINKEKEGGLMEETPSSNSLRTSRRKQKTLAKVERYPNRENDDDDITDDETQTYSIDDNIRARGPDYEEKFSKSLAMESSSPVF